MEHENPDQGAEQPEVETTEETAPPAEVAPEPFREAVESADPEPEQDVVNNEPDVEDLSQQHTDEDEPKAPTRTFFGREYTKDENGALRQTSR